MAVKRMKIGIMSPADMRARTIAIAKGEYVPRSGEPKVWFPSLESVAQLLSEGNRAMLRVIAAAQPESIAEAAKVVDRKPGNLSRTLNAMERYGIVKLVRGGPAHKRGRKPVKPVVQATDFDIQTFSLGSQPVSKGEREHVAEAG